jgi:methylmalonyl-CoA epimerase
MPLGMQIKRVHHLTVAVRDAEAAREAFETLFGARADQTREVPAFGVRVRDMRLGDDVLQMAAPLGENSPIRRFVERRGEGFYNLALEVDDLDGAVSELAERGIKVSEPIEATPGLRSAFVTMAATHGLSIQLVEVMDASETPADLRAPESDEASDGKQAELNLTPDEWSDADYLSVVRFEF